MNHFSTISQIFQDAVASSCDCLLLKMNHFPEGVPYVNIYTQIWKQCV